MKKIILIFSTLLISCLPSKKEIDKKESLRKYKDGDIVYLKPDSNKGLIQGLCFGCGCGKTDTGIVYKVWSGNKEYQVEEYVIYGN